MLCQFHVQQSDSVLYILYIYICVYIFFFRFFSIIGYYKILNIVPCAMQQDLVIYLFHIQQFVSVNPKLLIYPSLLNFGNHTFVFYVCGSVSVLQISSYVSFFQIPHISDIIMIYVFLCLTYFTQYDNLQSIHVAANGTISFLFMAE